MRDYDSMEWELERLTEDDKAFIAEIQSRAIKPRVPKSEGYPELVATYFVTAEEMGRMRALGVWPDD